MVRALDATVTKIQGDLITETLRKGKDSRIKYVIWNRRSYSPPTWQWKAYTGAPHDTHFHVSFLPVEDGNGQVWNLGGDMPWSKPGDPILTLEDADNVFEYQGTFAPGSNQASYNPADEAELNDRVWIVLARITDELMKG
jgi:hypothetical protein